MVSVRSGTRTQMAAVFSCGLLLAIILWLGPFLADLPKVNISNPHSFLPLVCPCFDNRRRSPVNVREDVRTSETVAHLPF